MGQAVNTPRTHRLSQKQLSFHESYTVHETQNLFSKGDKERERAQRLDVADSHASLSSLIPCNSKLLASHPQNDDVPTYPVDLW